MNLIIMNFKMPLSEKKQTLKALAKLKKKSFKKLYK